MYISEIFREFDQIIFNTHMIFVCKKGGKYYSYDCNRAEDYNTPDEFREVADKSEINYLNSNLDFSDIRKYRLYCSVSADNYPRVYKDIAIFIGVPVRRTLHTTPASLFTPVQPDDLRFIAVNLRDKTDFSLSLPVTTDTRLLCVYRDDIYYTQSDCISRYNYSAELRGSICQPTATKKAPEIIQKNAVFICYPVVYKNIIVFDFLQDNQASGYRYARIFYDAEKRKILYPFISWSEALGLFSRDLFPVQIGRDDIRKISTSSTNGETKTADNDIICGTNRIMSHNKFVFDDYYWYYVQEGEYIRFICYNINTGKKYSVKYRNIRVEKSAIVGNKFISRVVARSVNASDTNNPVSNDPQCGGEKHYLLILTARESVLSANFAKQNVDTVNESEINSRECLSRIDPEIKQKIITFLLIRRNTSANPAKLPREIAILLINEILDACYLYVNGK